MADPLEHATGLEKKEMLAKAAGSDVSSFNVFYEVGALFSESSPSTEDSD